MNPLPPEEQDLHAYVDGQLDEEQRQWVEHYLAAQPAIAAQVAKWQADAQSLRIALDAFTPPLAPRSVPLQNMRARVKKRRQLRVAMAFTVVFSLGLGGVAGWQLHAGSEQHATLPMEDAIQAYRLFSHDHVKALDVVAKDNNQMNLWMSQYFINGNLPPNLENYGFKIIGGRLMATDRGPSALIVYQDAAGMRVTYYIRPSGALAIGKGERKADNLMAQYWSDKRYNYAVISPANSTLVAPLQKAIADYT